MYLSRSSLMVAFSVLATVALPAMGHAQDTIKIGAPLSISGKFVSYGAAAKRGVEMAVDIYGGKIGNKKIEILFRDTQSDRIAFRSADKVDVFYQRRIKQPVWRLGKTQPSLLHEYRRTTAIN